MRANRVGGTYLHSLINRFLASLHSDHQPNQQKQWPVSEIDSKPVILGKVVTETRPAREIHSEFLKLFELCVHSMARQVQPWEKQEMFVKEQCLFYSQVLERGSS